MQAESAVSMMSPLVGYTSAVQLHEGAETVVYRARVASTGAPVIVKVTKNEYPAPKELARLRREFSILRDLDLPQTPKAHGLEEQGHGLALVMADLGHATLREVLDREPLSIETTLNIVISLSDVLAEVHRRRVIHKDITPRNILVDMASRKAHLIDFGISARLSQEMQSAGGLSVLEGTLVYIAPEQTGRMNRAVDLRADLYSLGAVLYEMLTGSVPFPASTPTQLIHSHIAQRPESPHERAPSVPEPLSDIVMMLLAKTPEERYQSDAGLKADLEECLKQWQAKKSIAPFPLRRRDKATELRRTQKLYGREGDIAALLEAFERVCLRGPELCLVSGYSGVGKSALVNEIHKLTAHKGGYFVSGKFDQISRDAPLAPVVQAFRELILQLLTEPGEVLARWKGELLEALGENGRLITDLIPELELIIGAQPEVLAIAPDQAKNRFELTLQNFLDVFAAPEHPLVIFLDDLQWIDPASLNFLRLLLVNAYSENVLLIGAYRDNEVELGHPLLSTLDELERAGLRTTRIQLRPLTEEMVLSLVADTLTSRTDEVSDLAKLVYEKTQGNPFFAHQFMVTLHEKGLLSFDAAAGAWTWDVNRIRGANVTDNVVDMMVSKLQRLAPATQKAVMLASCIGSHFDLRSLSIIGERSITDTAGALWEAMREGLVIPLDGDYRLLEGASESAAIADDFNVRYRFSHDRILHAAYTLVESDQKQQLHLSIGRLLRRRTAGAPRDEDLLEIVRHLNQGAKGITDDAERIDLARLNMRAGRKARAATAYKAAADYFRAGIGLLLDTDWEREYDLCFALYVEGGEYTYLSGDVDGANALFSAVLPRTKSELERAWILRVRARIALTLSQFSESLTIGCEALTLLGCPMTMEDLLSPPALYAEIGQLSVNLGGRRIEDLINAPELHDPRLRAVLEVIDIMTVPGYYISPIAFGHLAFKGTNLALKHGHTNVCAYPYAACAYTFALVMGRVEEGLAFGKLAQDLLKKFPNPAMVTRVNLVLGCIHPMEGSMREAVAFFNAAVQAGPASGDFAMLGGAAFLGTQLELLAGDHLEDILANADKNLAIIRRTKERAPLATMTLIRQAVACLLGRTKTRTSFSDESFDEEAYLAPLVGPIWGNTLVHYNYLKTQIYYLHGDINAATVTAAETEKLADYASETPPMKVFAFYQCMRVLASPPPTTPEAAAERAATLEKYKGKLDLSAACSPKGFQHLKVLVEAEMARDAGEFENAIRLYDQAIQLSHEIKAPHIEALASELYAKLYLSIGATKAASAFMKDAFRAYLHWGATPKAEALEAEHGHLLPSFGREGGRSKSTTTSTSSEHTNTHSTILSRTTLGSLRDAGLIVRAAQAIAVEVDLPKVIERLAALVLENAGAQRGALILSRDGELVVAAHFGDSSASIEEGLGRPLSEVENIPQSVVLYVARIRESVVLDETGAVSRFSDDPYLAREAPKSILCLPLLHQSRLSGVLYLENRVMAGVFDAARVELLALLSAQAAIAIENARLISNVRAANTEVKRMNEQLEREVARRTEELGHANKDLLGANDRLERELERRVQIEQERTTLQEQVIVAQRARLAEMSTPLIPITDEIVVMPLIGTLDSERAAQVLTTALEGAQRHRARVVILDITGVKQVDTNVAGMLLNVAGALRMLGTEAVLTGIAPEIAQTLAGLGIGLASFVTRGTLQSGMSYALQRVNGSGSPSARAGRQGPRSR